MLAAFEAGGVGAVEQYVPTSTAVMMMLATAGCGACVVVGTDAATVERNLGYGRTF